MRRILCAAVAAITLAAGGASAQTLTLGTKLELNTLDPHFFNGFPQASSHSQIFDGLTYQNDRQQLEPALARNPLQDPRVRRALSLAIDRAAICDRLMEGSCRPASQMLPPSFPGTSQRLKPDPLDLTRARALLAEADLPNGFRLALHTTTDRYPKDSQIAQAIGQMWTRLGLQVAIEGVPGQVFFGAARRQELSALIAQYGTIEASEGPRAVLHTNDAQQGLGAANRVRYSNPRVDALMIRPAS